MTDDLVAFIKARLDEDEKHARRAASDAGEHWPSQGVRLELDDDVEHDGFLATWHVGAHVARHDPDSVLRGVQAKRKILDIHHAGKEVPHGYKDGQCITTMSCDGCGWGGPCDDPWTDDINECPTLRAVALEWSTHPDYQAGWAP